MYVPWARPVILTEIEWVDGVFPAGGDTESQAALLAIEKDAGKFDVTEIGCAAGFGPPWVALKENEVGEGARTVWAICATENRMEALPLVLEESVATTVTKYWPSSAGVPLTRPEGPRLVPSGTAPFRIDHV